VSIFALEKRKKKLATCAVSQVRPQNLRALPNTKQVKQTFCLLPCSKKNESVN
jgi:hypothetical protein